MANKVLYNTVSGGESEGDYPAFIVDPDFAIYSPKVSGIKKNFSIQLNSQQVSDGYFLHNGQVRVDLDSTANTDIAYEYSLYFYPTMYDDGTIEDTWFFSWDQNNSRFLDNWSRQISVKYSLQPNGETLPSFNIGSTLLSSNRIREINHDNFGEIELGYPDFGADGIWMYIKNKITQITELSNAVGWCWFNREYASSFTNSSFFWFADSAHMSQASLNNIGSFTNSQCVLFFSQNISSMCSAIVNTSGELFISVISDEQKTNYYKLVA